MKQYILPALKLTLFSFLLLVVIYTGLVWSIAQAAPGNGEGETVAVNGRVVGFAKEGQLFNSNGYFWGRPSAVDYNGASSGGSNKGPSNPEYLQEVQARIDTLLAHHPGLSKSEIPSEMVTASGSGLDPDISPEAGYIQVKRIAQERQLPEQAVRQLVEQHTQRPLAGILGPGKVNVLELNIALDEMKSQ